MNKIAELRNKALAYEAEHRIIPKAIGVCAALSTGVITASAETGATSVDISTVTDSITTNLTDLVSKVGVACAGVVGAGLTIFGLRWAVTKVMSFFRAIGK